MQTAEQSGVKRLYHYQGDTLEWLRDALMNRRVHVSNLRNVNDPWDCRPYFQVSINDPESRRKWGQRLQATYDDLPQHLRDDLAAQMTGEWYHNKPLLLLTLDKMRGWVAQFNVERWRIYCLTSRPDSVLMWSHYTQKHTGICLEFDTGYHPFSLAFRVKYEERLPRIGPEEFSAESKRMAEAILLTKSEAWSYEREYRILARPRNIDPTFSVAVEEDYLAVPQGAITGVIAGCNADVARIRAVVQEYAPSMPVKRAVRIPNEYELQIVSD